MVYTPTKNKYAVEYKTANGYLFIGKNAVDIKTAKKFNSRLAAENAAKKLDYGVKYYVVKL